VTDQPRRRVQTAEVPQTTGTAGATRVELHESGGAWKRNLVFIWIGVFVGLLGANFVFPFIPFYLEDLGVQGESNRAFWTGISASVTGLSLTLTAPIWGSMADRFGRKPMFMRALVGAGVLIALMGLAQVLWHFVLLRFLMGAFAGTMGAAAALVAATTPRVKVGYALGMLQTGQFAANMIGPAVGGYVAASLGMRESFFFCAALYGIAVVLVWLFVGESSSAASVQDEAPPPGRPRGEGSLIGNLRVVIRERQVVLMLLLLFALWLSTTFVRPVMPLSIDDFGHDTGLENDVLLDIGPIERHVKKEAATGIVFAAVGLTSTLAALSVAPLGQRIGYRKSVAGAAAITGLLFFPVAMANSFAGFLLLFAATGLFQGAMVPGTNALIAASTPEGKHGSTFGLAASMQSMALLIGPAAGGAVSAVFGIHAVYVVIAVILLVTAVAAQLFIREPEVFRTG
jgi:DHA1 family multidrug resistance protein-like MFS transporter